jgi:trans-2,3-dihydro-3-hydroxyanthranilate isomerase
VRVFTRDDVGGNHLGVVDDITGLDGDAMQRIANELGFSETIFIDDSSAVAPTVRIFTPAAELPFAGHPLVGAAWVLTVQGSSPAGSLRCGIGEVHIRVDGDLVWIDVRMSSEVAPKDDARWEGGVAGFFAAAGIANVVSSARVLLPYEYFIGELESPAAVAALAPDMDALAAVFGTLVYARVGDRVKARFFAPHTGVPEDPATGSAAVALATVLRSRGEHTGRLTIDQGEEIGHPSTIQLTWAADTAAIGGTVRLDEIRSLVDEV